MTQTPHQERSLVTTAAKVVGAVFLLVGILGFIPGITSNYSSLSFAGHMSEAKLLGIFQVSILHNIVHLLFGIAGIAMAKRADSARTYLVGGGIIYLVLWIYGLVTSDQLLGQLRPRQHRGRLAAPGPRPRHDRPGRRAVAPSRGVHHRSLRPSHRGRR